MTSNTVPQRKPYQKPALVVHGDLRKLTQSGSRGNRENQKGNDDPGKIRP